MCPLWGLGQGPEGAPKPRTPLVHLRPGASWGTQSGGARGSPPPPCTRLLADHKRKGKRTREARPGAVTGSYLRAPVGPDTAREGRFPFPTRLLWDAPPSCGPQPSRDTARTVSAARPLVIYTQQWPADSPQPRRPGRGGGDASIPSRTPWRGQGGRSQEATQQQA